MITHLSFQKSLSFTSNHKRPLTGKEWTRDPSVNKPGESTLSGLEEDQLLEIANDSSLKSPYETTSNLHTFWIKGKAQYPEMATKALKSLLPFPTSFLCEAGFSAVTATKTSSGLPLILHYGELYNYFIIHYNVIITEIKCTINVMCLNHPETIPHPTPVHGKIVFHKTGPWGQKGRGARVYSTDSY